MKDRVHKWIYINPLDMDHFEGWLEEMARKGLLFERMSYWGVVFRRGKPADLRYRLEPTGRLWTRESKDYCRELGWDYLGQAGQYFELYANPDPEAPELHSDPGGTELRAGSAGQVASLALSSDPAAGRRLLHRPHPAGGNLHLPQPVSAVL